MVSIIIPIRYRADLTQVCLDSVKNYTKDYELILVQEGEELEEFFNKYYPKRIKNVIPKGFAGAMNAGLKEVKGEYVCFLNNDTVVIPRWMDEMLLAFEDKRVGLVSPTQSAVRTIQSVNLNKGQRFDYTTDPLALLGTCFVVRKDILDNIGSFDESLGLGGGEDNDLCARIVEAGYVLAVARRSFIYHYGCASFRELYGNNPLLIREKAKEQYKKFEEKYNNKYHL